MLWADGQISLHNNYFLVLFPFKPLNAVLGRIWIWKKSARRPTAMTFQNVTWSKLKKPLVSRPTNPVSITYRTTHQFTGRSPARVRPLISAAKFHGHSLNNVLLTRPDLLQKLMHVLLQLRKHPYAVPIYIEGMFFQAGFIPRDRPPLPFFHFLWREKPTTELPVFQYTRYYGSETIARSAEIKTMSGNLIRSIMKLAPILTPLDPS